MIREYKNGGIYGKLSTKAKHIIIPIVGVLLFSTIIVLSILSSSIINENGATTKNIALFCISWGINILVLFPLWVFNTNYWVKFLRRQIQQKQDKKNG